MKKEWIKIEDDAEEGTIPKISVPKSGLSQVKGREVDSVEQGSTQVTYTLGGAWKGTFKHSNDVFDTVSVPRAASTTEEGAPEIPQEGIFVAVPKGVTNIKVKTIHREMKQLSGNYKLKPSPKPITEIEYIEGKEEYKKKSEFYESDNEYPGKDFDFLGLKTIESIPVVHLIVYLAQYKPLSGSLSIIKKITLEITYDVPPQTDAVPKVREISPLMGDLIIDFGNINEDKIEKDSTFFGMNDFPNNYDDPISNGLTFNPEIIENPIVTRPVTPIGIGTITPVRIITLKRTDMICEYVIITPKNLKTAVKPLLDAKSGWPHYAKIATTETISSEFPGASLKESIKQFLTWAWDNWRVPPRFVVLAGDTDIIPTNMTTIGGGTYASDHYYADVHGSLAPEIVISRIPTSDFTKMLQICQKLKDYEKLRGPDWGGWQNEVLLVAYQSSVYKDCSDDIADAISSRFKVTKKYGGSSTKQEVINELNNGVLIANYRGHGSKTNWSSSNGINVQEIKNLTTEKKPPMVFCICCQNAWIDDNNTETVVEAFLRGEKTVAVFGASRNSPTYANNDFNRYLFRAIMDGENTPGRIVQRAKTLMIANHGNSTTHKQDVIMYMLFGDPTARVTSNVEFLRGMWDMDHDGWKGTININRIWNHRIEKIGNCGYPVWSFSGTYTRGNQSFALTGKIGGRDSNNLNPGCKRSDHKIQFKIDFATNNKQQFSGYITTWTRNILAGYTWWAKRPFCWYAKKR